MSQFNKSELEEMIAVIQAYKEGKEIEYRSKWKDTKWQDANIPLFNFNDIKYRVKQEPVIHDEIPWSAVKSMFKYYARDENGDTYFYTDPPQLRKSHWYGSIEGCSASWYGSIEGCSASARALNIKIGNQPWDKSLQQRPEGV